MLSDVKIREALQRGDLIIEGCEESCFRPASYALRLGIAFARERGGSEVVDTRGTDTSDYFETGSIAETGLLLEPRALYLLSSLERVSLGPRLAGLLGVLSCYTRVGLSVNGGSNFVAPTFGTPDPSLITFEVVNLSARAVRLYPTVKFCHLLLFEVDSPGARAYTGIYSSSVGPVAADFRRRPAR